MKTNKIGIELNNFIWNGIEKFMIRNDMKMIKKTLLIFFEMYAILTSILSHANNSLTISWFFFSMAKCSAVFWIIMQLNFIKIIAEISLKYLKLKIVLNLYISNIIIIIKLELNL